MGHGLPAPLFTAKLRCVLRAFIRKHEQPGQILEQMNNYLREGRRLYAEGMSAEGDDAPVCVAVVILDTATGEGIAAAAGMELLVQEAQPAGTLEKVGRPIFDGARDFARGILKDDACVLLGRRQ